MLALIHNLTVILFYFFCHLLSQGLRWVDRLDLALAPGQTSTAQSGAWAQAGAAHRGGAGASQTEAGATQTKAWGRGGHGGEVAEEEVSAVIKQIVASLVKGPMH